MKNLNKHKQRDFSIQVGCMETRLHQRSNRMGMLMEAEKCEKWSKVNNER